MEAEKVLRGKVKRIMDVRGYCFVEVQGQDDDVFCHVSNFLDQHDFADLEVGGVVEIGEIEETEKGVQAKDVRIVKGAEEDE